MGCRPTELFNALKSSYLRCHGAILLVTFFGRGKGDAFI